MHNIYEEFDKNLRMFGNAKSQFEEEIVALKNEVERLQQKLDDKTQEAKHNWNRYEECHREKLDAQHNSVSKEMHTKALADKQEEYSKLHVAALEIKRLYEEEQIKHDKTQNILDRKKQQCKRYKNKIEKFENKRGSL